MTLYDIYTTILIIIIFPTFFTDVRWAMVEMHIRVITADMDIWGLRQEIRKLPPGNFRLADVRMKTTAKPYKYMKSNVEQPFYMI